MKKFQFEADIKSEYKQHFLKSIEENAKEVLFDLEELLPLYSAIVQNRDANEMDKFFDKCVMPEVLVEEESSYYLSKPEFSSFYASFNDWVKRYFLTKVWIKQIAFYTLDQWQDIKIPKNRFFGDTGEIYIVKGFDSFKSEFEFNFVDFLRDGGEALHKKALEEYKRAKALIKDMEREATLRGYSQHYTRNIKSVKWLVRWSVQAWTKDEILQEISNETDIYHDVSSIDKAFRYLRKIDLPVRG